MKTIEILNQVSNSLSETQKQIFDNSVNILIDYAKNDIIYKVKSINKTSKVIKKSIDIMPHIKTINELTQIKKSEMIFEEENIDLAHKQVIGIIRQVVDR